MIVDGRAIASDIYREINNVISHRGQPLHLTVFTCAPNFETQKYLALKRKKAAEVDIAVNVIEFPLDITTEEIVQSIEHATMQTDGIIVQLPFPSHIDVDSVLANIPNELDVDILNGHSDRDGLLTPVVGAIKEIADRYHVFWSGKDVVVIGQGRLVGKPAALWAERMGGNVSIVTEETVDPDNIIKTADIIISGVGKPNLIKPDMIKSQVVIFDAGTSEEGGELKGDVAPACSEKSHIFTPVPGGIGPVTVAILLRNLVLLSERR